MPLPWFQKKIPVLSPREGYDCWASGYSAETNPVKNLSNELVLKWLTDLVGKTVLDAGCGTGYFCSKVKSLGASRILGFDFSPAMIEEARRNCPEAEFKCADLSTITYNKEFDFIICALVLGHIEKIQPVLDVLTKALADGGEIIITDFHPFQTLKQARRTFKDHRGKVYEIRHYLHSISSIASLLRLNGVEPAIIEEPQWNNEPVIYGIRAKKI